MISAFRYIASSSACSMLIFLLSSRSGNNAAATNTGAFLSVSDKHNRPSGSFAMPTAFQSRSTIAATGSMTQMTLPSNINRKKIQNVILFVSDSSVRGGQEEEEEEKEENEEEWHPRDPAQTTPQLLSSLWHMIAQGSSMVKGDSMTVIFPNMQKEFTPSYLNRLLGHLDSCKDVCDDFGINTVLVPHTGSGGGGKLVTGFTVKSYRNPDKEGEDGEYKFDYDPMWVDGPDMDYIPDAVAVYDDYDDDEKGLGSLASVKDGGYPEIADPIPDDDDKIVAVTKRWVDKMMSDMGICPFTSGPDMAGLPMGRVFYTVDRSTRTEDMYARYWKEVVRVERNPERDLSTTLLIAPEFCFHNIEAFENFSNTLTQPLEALRVEDLIQLVFFHPRWTFRDGGERAGVGAAANYARRSPWPMINLLRTKQVRAAQRGIPTGLVYQQNEKTLNAVGTEKLETMLRMRDWSPIADVEVNRRDMEALRVAQDFQQTGAVKAEDTSFVHDSTPAASKVDRKQIEGGNIVRVVMDALEKRLEGGEGGTVQRLSGPETSAAMMASDFLLEELDRIASSPSIPVAASTEMKSQQKGYPGSIFEDEDDYADEKRASAELSVLFGGDGILGKKEEEGFGSSFSEGMSPDSFY